MIYILLFILLFVLFILIKTALIKPTSAHDAKVKLDESERSVEYGKQLAKMVQKETISFRDQEDRTKFYEFHEILEELFPLVHKNCEKHVFNGSLLFNGQEKVVKIQFF